MTSKKQGEQRFLKLVDAVWDALGAHEADADEFFLVCLYVVTQMIEDQEDIEERDGMARIAYRMIHDAVGVTLPETIQDALDKRKAGFVGGELPPERRTTPRWR